MEYIKLITEYIKGIMEYFHWITCSTLSGAYCTVLYIGIYWVHTVLYHAVVHCLSWRRNSWSDSTMRFSGLRWNGEIRVPLPLFLLYSKTHWSSKSPSPKNLIIYIYLYITHCLKLKIFSLNLTNKDVAGLSFQERHQQLTVYMFVYGNNSTLIIQQGAKWLNVY